MSAGVILNTRPAVYRARMHEAFAMPGWSVVDCPVLTPQTVSTPLPPPDGFDALIFTSQIPVPLFPATDAWRGKTVLAVGPATAAAARDAGFTAVVQTGGDARDLAAYIASSTLRLALYPSAAEVTADLAVDFPGRIRRVVLYDMTPADALPPAVLARIRNSPVLAPLFSRRSAQVLADLLAKAHITAENARIAAVAISADVLPAAQGPWHRRAVADKPTLEAVAAATRDLAATLKEAPS